MKLEISKNGERRFPCQVPHCGKTTPADRAGGTEWLCADHWKLVPARWKSTLRISARRYQKHQTSRYWRMNNRAWRRCVKRAIEVAAGIA